MNVKDLREILSSIGEECDDFPVRIAIGFDEEHQVKTVGLDEFNWELTGHTKENSTLQICKESL